MFESGVGFNTNVTRQCSGIGFAAGAAVPPGPEPAGGVNTPAGTLVAAVTVARSSATP